MGDIDYDTDLSAGKQVHAFKFADTIAVNFQCSLKLELKDTICKVDNFSLVLCEIWNEVYNEWQFLATEMFPPAKFIQI